MKTKKQYLDEVMQAITIRTYLGKCYGIEEDNVHSLIRGVEEIIGEGLTNPMIFHIGLKLILLLSGGGHEVDPSLKALALDYFLEYATLIYEEAEIIIKRA